MKGNVNLERAVNSRDANRVLVHAAQVGTGIKPDWNKIVK